MKKPIDVLSEMSKSEVMTVPGVATYLNCHSSTVYRLVSSGALPAFRLGGDWRFLRSQIDEWIGKRHVRPNAEGTSGGQHRAKGRPKPKR